MYYGDRRVEGNVVDFINHKERIFHIGRLDKPSEGLLLMTNDGDIVNKILRAGNQHEKEYLVKVDRTSFSNYYRSNVKRGPNIGYHYKGV